MQFKHDSCLLIILRGRECVLVGTEWIDTEGNQEKGEEKEVKEKERMCCDSNA